MSDMLVLALVCGGFFLFLVVVVGFFVTKNAARQFFWGILEIIIGVLSLAGFIIIIINDLRGDCSLKGLSVVCSGSSVTTTTGIGMYVILLILGIGGLFEGMKTLKKAKAMKAQLVQASPVNEPKI